MELQLPRYSKSDAILSDHVDFLYRNTQNMVSQRASFVAFSDDGREMVVASERRNTLQESRIGFWKLPEDGGIMSAAGDGELRSCLLEGAWFGCWG